MRSQITFLFIIALLVITPIIWIFSCYWPALPGPFIFDDIPNLAPLANHPHLPFWERVQLFLVQGDAGPTGRPVSLLSFFLNDNTWPSQPTVFRITNLLLHCLNGLLVMLLAFKLSQLLGTKQRASLLIAVTTALFWSLHPIQINAVAYIIQRMTELSALFSLAAMITYLYGRCQLKHSIWQGYLLMTSGMVIFGLLGLFSKENAVLSPVFMLVLELTLLQSKQPITHITFQLWRWLILGIPTLVIFWYLLQAGLVGYDARVFSLSERLLTQTRVVSDYLIQILLPNLSGSGLFHDDYPISHSILTPPQTLVALLTILGLFSSSLLLARRYPLYSFAVLWFFAGHLIESTTIPLELYFEHRNYLPLFGPAFAITYAIWTYHGQGKKMLRFGLGGFILILSFLTWQQAWLWGNPATATAVWLAENPNSKRAIEAHVAVLTQKQDFATAQVILQQALQRYPNDSILTTDYWRLLCQFQQITPDRLEQMVIQAAYFQYQAPMMTNLEHLVQATQKQACLPLEPARMSRILHTLVENPNIKERFALHLLHLWLGQLYAQTRQLDLTIKHLDQAFRYRQRIEIPIQQAIYLISAGLLTDAQEYLQRAKTMLATQPTSEYQQRIDELEQVIQRQK